MNLSKTQKIILGVVGGLVLIFAIIIITGWGLRPKEQKVTLTVWGIDERESVEATNEGFMDETPGLTIKYTEIPEANYEETLVDALAAGQGPDVFMFRSDWIKKHSNKVVPADEEVFPVSRFTSLFPDVAEQDFVLNGEIYASPLFIDTLALYYNTDIFNRRTIAIPPKTWDEFRTTVAKGVPASFGGYAPLVARAGDIMNALLMQSGADLSLQNKSFVRLSGVPGTTALGIYLGIKAPGTETYAGFANETLGMMIDYQSAKTNIAVLNPYLKFSIAPLPQISANSEVVPARYYGLAVSNKSTHQKIGWDYVMYATTNAAVSDDYIAASGRPPALRSLIQTYSGDPELGVFAKQALIAGSWNMPASEGVYEAFNRMIQSALSGQSASVVLAEAETAINKLVR